MMAFVPNAREVLRVGAAKGIAKRILAARRGLRSQYVGDGLILTMTPYGHMMYVSASDTSLTPSLLLLRMWERPVTGLFRRVVRPGMRVVEVGANVGWFTLQACELVGAAGHVFAFEASPRTFGLLHRNLLVNALLGRCTAIQKAVCDVVGTLPLYEVDDFFALASLEDKDDHWKSWMHRDTAVTEVATTTLDESLAPIGHTIDVLKIDVEGAEPRVFAGMDRVIENSPRLQVIAEYTEAGSAKDYLAFWNDRGFDVRLIEGARRVRAIGSDELSDRSQSELFITRRP